MTLQSEDMGKLVAGALGRVWLGKWLRDIMRDFRPAHREAQPETEGGGEAMWWLTRTGMTPTECLAKLQALHPTPEGQTEGAVETVARIIDPWPFGIVANIQHTEKAAEERGKATDKARRILAALASKGV